MPIVPPQLDDLRYDRSFEELRRRIPVYAPEWTDHNDSDPGITLLQLFSYLAEQIGYRLNRIPEKNHVELLKLLGVRLNPALAARTRVALLLSDPSTLTGYTLAAPTRVRATKGNPPPSFESDVAIDVVPAEPRVLLTTRFSDLRDVRFGDPDPLPNSLPTVPNPKTHWLTVVWDGKAPKPKDMPLEPVTLLPDVDQRYLWIGLNLNPARDAGFRGVRVTLTVQLDDDEQPSLTTTQKCEPVVPGAQAPPRVDWLAYYDAVQSQIVDVPGRIDDSTDSLRHSGTLRFTVPFGIGSIPDAEWAPLRAAVTITPVQACLALAHTIGNGITTLGALDPRQFRDAVLLGATAVDTEANKVKPPVAHPLDPKLRDPSKVNGWLRLGPLPAAPRRLRILTFNAVPVTHATTVLAELLGVATGRPGQEFTLRNGNVLASTLELAIQEDPDPTVPLTSWTAVDSLDAATPFDRVFDLDREAGVVRFGDGIRGRIPPLVPRAGNVVALRYRAGGGKAGEVPVAALTAMEGTASGVGGVVNFVAATGGRDAETLDDAKIRARKELSTRSRAVTAGDFDWIARQTPGVRVARVQVIPLRRPLPAGSAIVPVGQTRCAAPPAGVAGIDDMVAPGAVTVVVVPDVDGAEPVPVPSFLQAVCAYLDEHRLVTTELYVAPPQYFRLCNVVVEVKGRPGYTRAQLQDLVEARLATYLHVLRGGDDGTGFPFGGQVHVADLVAQVFRTEGVERVESFSAEFTRTKSNATPRDGKIVMCAAATDEFERVTLSAEENVSLDAGRFTLSTV